MAILEGILVDKMARLIFGIFLLFTAQLILADPLEEYNRGYATGWEHAYSQFTKLEKEEYPEAPKFTALIKKEEGLRWGEQGIIDGVNFAGSDIFNKQWENYTWWQKLLNPEDWFMVTFITD